MLPADTLLGPYKIIAPIGAGGMGEVYRALDTRLGREVALKVLSQSLAQDEEALHRFEQEARAVGMLNHPNIVAIYDVGVQDSRHYIVTELLEGESLRVRLRQGPIHARKATDYAVQVARGLGAAHEKGIIHRDLKPENLFLTRDGHVKILDFGLVKLMGGRLPGGDQPVDDHAPTLPVTPTEPGRILGTVGYMAPEQVRGGSGDHRSDIFAFGAIVYEMLAGRPAFRGDSPIETLNAILKEEPQDLSDLGVRVPPALERVIHHCLEKNPDERFQSARDLAFGLGSMSGLTSRAIIYPLLPPMRLRSLIKPLLITLAVLLALAGAYVIGTRQGTRAPAAYKRLTFRSGTIFSARFSPDGQTVFYGARWAGAPVTIFAVRGDSPESRDLDFGISDILAVSSKGQLAISLRRHPIGYLRDSGTLAQVAIAGGAPREIAEDVESADWTPDGSALAIVRSVDGTSRLEYPIGKVLYETAGWITHPRFSPRGDAIAFLDHPFTNDDRGSVALITLADGKRQSLTPEYQSAEGLAWWPDGNEIWFGADATGGAHGRSILAVRASGWRARRVRVVTTGPTWLWMHDIARDGSVLISQQNIRAGISAIIPGRTNERDLSWLDYSVARDFAADGSTLAFSESGEAGGEIFGVYVRRIDGSPAIRIGEGTTEALSPDKKWVLSIPRNRQPAQIMMLPTGAGQPRMLTNDAISHRAARWFPDGQRIFFHGNRKDEAPRVWVQELAGGAPRAVTPEGVTAYLATPDGKRLLGRDATRHFFFYAVVDANAKPQPIPALQRSDVPVRFADDGSLFVASFGKIPAILTKVNLLTAERTLWREVVPADAAGLINVGPVLPTPDGKTMVYSYTRLLSDLYVWRGR
ncbi:MAG TPA: protein kinase [Thermoanaerobaculia bacterium]|nr:protein kinase [Thermoanaerobaculia bacterium]